MLAILNENYPKIRNLQSLSEFDDLTNFLLDTLGIKSLSEDLNEHNYKLKFMIEFMNSKFGFLTIPEIKEAFKMYVAKDFGHKEIYRNLDTIVVSDVLNCFVDLRSEKLRAYTQSKQKLVLEAKNKISEADSEKIMTEAVNNKYLEFLETENISEPINHIFDELIERKILKMPSNEFPKLYDYYDRKLQEAKRQIEVELKTTPSLTKKEKDKISEELLKIANNSSSKAEIRAKKLVLIDYFTKQKELGKNLIFDN